MQNIITWSLLIFGNPLPLFAALTTVMVSNTDRELLSKNFFNDLTNSKEVGTNWPLFGGKKIFSFYVVRGSGSFCETINISTSHHKDVLVKSFILSFLCTLLVSIRNFVFVLQSPKIDWKLKYYHNLFVV